MVARLGRLPALERRSEPPSQLSFATQWNQIIGYYTFFRNLGGETIDLVDLWSRVNGRGCKFEISPVGLPWPLHSINMVPNSGRYSPSLPRESLQMMTLSSGWPLGVAFAMIFAVATPAASAGSYSFSDEVFAPGSWALRDRSTSGSGASASWQQVEGAGVSGTNAARVSLVTAPGAQSQGILEWLTISYDPSTQGAISQVSMSMWLRRAAPSPNFRFAIFQGDFVWSTTDSFVAGASWSQAQITTTASAWSLVANLGTGLAPASPDFSSSGDLIRFGFRATNSLSASASTGSTTSADVSDFQVTVTSVPGPGAAACASVVLTLLPRRRRRR
jgi:hypothetical protein